MNRWHPTRYGREAEIPQFKWTEIPRGDVHPAHARIYATMNRKGEIVLNATAYGRLGEPEAFRILYNKRHCMIALIPSKREMENAYPVRKNAKGTGRVVRAARLLIDNLIELEDTLLFHDALINKDGVLMLDLSTARVSPRAHSQCRKK